jgi:2-dehydro-3-deoxyphosphogluconate aldolase/(4S)-4-hydroxy-2-oxoglutarate aldolase
MQGEEKSEILQQLRDFGVVPVVAINQAKDAIQLGQALLSGGLPCAEITFRTAAAEEVIKRIASELPQILVGAGTVLTVEQAERAVSAGARFIVSPGFDEKVVSWCLGQGVVVTPGVATPTEINMALDHGLSILKFFPAEALGGIKTLKAISAPYVNVKFMPTGGVNLENLAEYLRLPSVHACGGSWLVKRSLIEAGDFNEITRRVIEALEVVHQVRMEGAGS